MVLSSAIYALNIRSSRRRPSVLMRWTILGRFGGELKGGGKGEGCLELKNAYALEI